jgi:hypothetical protein
MIQDEIGFFGNGQFSRHGERCIATVQLARIMRTCG